MEKLSGPREWYTYMLIRGQVNELLRTRPEMDYAAILDTARIWQRSPREDVSVAATIVLSLTWLYHDSGPETDKVQTNGVTFNTSECSPDFHVYNLHARTVRDPAYGIAGLIHIKICKASGWWPYLADEAMSERDPREMQRLNTEIASATEHLKSLGICID